MKDTIKKVDGLRLIKSLRDVPIKYSQWRKVSDSLRVDKCRDELFYIANDPKLFIELGTQYGVLAHRACHYLPDTTRIYSVDLWPNSRRFVDMYSSGCYNRFSWAKNVEPWLGKKIFGIEGETTHAANLFDDGTVDICFVDADHETKAVVRDCVAWWPKVRPGGWLVGHDVTGQWAKKVLLGVKRFMAGIGRTDWEIRELYGNAIHKKSRDIAKCWCVQK